MTLPAHSQNLLQCCLTNTSSDMAGSFVSFVGQSSSSNQAVHRDHCKYNPKFKGNKNNEKHNGPFLRKEVYSTRNTQPI